MQDRVGEGDAWCRKPLEVTSLLAQTGGLTMLGLQSTDKTHTLVLSPQGLEDFEPKDSDSAGLFFQPIPLQNEDRM